MLPSPAICYQINYTLTAVPDDAAYFHAQFRRENPVTYKNVYTLVDGIHGQGQYVGTYLAWGSNNGGWWGEGEMHFFLDGDDYPTIAGTGVEDYFCGAYGFRVGNEGKAVLLVHDAVHRASRPSYLILLTTTARRCASGCTAGTRWTRSDSAATSASPFKLSAGGVRVATCRYKTTWPR